MKKRFWVFAYNNYYPKGGMADFQSSHDTMNEAIKAARDLIPEEFQDTFEYDGKFQKGHVVDSTNGAQVWNHAVGSKL